MSKKPFSVSMCVYGKDNVEHFKAAVESVLNQTVQPDEIVLVVDGPVPADMDAVICGYEKNSIFHVIRLAKNVGHGNARRTGLENCKYELVALMDADDLSVPTRFEQQLQMFEQQPDLSVVGGHIAEFITDSNMPVSRRDVKLTDREIREDIHIRCPMNQPAVMVKKSDVQAVGGYIDWYCDEDYYLWIRLAKAEKKFANVDEVLVNMRMSEDSYQRRGGWKYFVSEAKLQKYMLDKQIIGMSTYLVNIAKRLIVQVLLPNKVRGWVFKKFARGQVK